MTAKKAGGLGRGLSALLGDTSQLSEEGRVQTKSPDPIHFRMIPLHQIKANPFQPRTHFEEEALKELAESIRVQGIIQPITVRRVSENHYQLISGERRMQASKIAGTSEIPAFIRTANDQQMLEMALIENIQRENLNAIEISLSFKRLIAECNLNMEEMGARVGKKRATVNNYLRLLRLPPDIQAAVRDRRISMGHARALIAIEKIDQQIGLFNRIVEEELSVRKAEELAASISSGKPSTGSKKSGAKMEDPHYTDLRKRLQSHFGTKVSVKYNQKGKGEINIPFLDEEDLNRILEILEL
jgi:ParB family transcriptional regulator, chromosome partitioning protein